MKIKNIFDEVAEKYDAWYDSDEGMLIYKSELLCLTSLIEGVSFPMLEIGVGTGRFAIHFPDIIGVDRLQHPDEPRRMELPVKKYVEGAGLICIKAKIRSNT